MTRSYDQYCPIARALDLVGERWSLLVVRELLQHGPRRYSDLHAALDGCGTNILAARLKTLEAGGVVRRRRLPPPASATVYELTPYGEGLAPVLHQLAHWGARALGPPTPADVEPGWLPGALRMALPPEADCACVEFRIGDETASVAEGEVVAGPAETPPAAVVEGDPAGFYRLFVERDLGAVRVEGRRDAVESILAVLPPPVPTPDAPDPASS